MRIGRIAVAASALALPAVVGVASGAQASSCAVMTLNYSLTSGTAVALTPAHVTISYGGCVQFTNNTAQTATFAVGSGYSKQVQPSGTTPAGQAYVGRAGGRQSVTASSGPGHASGTITVGASPAPSPAPSHSHSPSPAPRPTHSPSTAPNPRPSPHPARTSSGPRVAPTPSRVALPPLPGSTTVPSPGAVGPPSLAPSPTPTPAPSSSAAPAVAGPLEPVSGRGAGLPAALAALAVVGGGAGLVRVLAAEPVPGLPGSRAVDDDGIVGPRP